MANLNMSKGRLRLDESYRVFGSGCPNLVQNNDLKIASKGATLNYQHEIVN